MIRTAWRALVRFLGSAWLALGLLIFVSIWSSVATFIPQDGDAPTKLAEWTASHKLIEPVAKALGLQHAFTSIAFLTCVVLLGLSTAVCSWRRTKVALTRSRLLRDAGKASASSLAEQHSLTIALDPEASSSDVLATAAEALGGLGFKMTRRDDVLSAVSSPWSVWGSAVFHWSLLALTIVVLVGIQLRAEGSMALAVGQTRPDAPKSYVWVHTGPLHDWAAVSRSIRLDKFEPDYKSGGIDRGAVPTVSVLDAHGRVVKTQRVYPNNMLHVGPLSINAPTCGLAATVALLRPDGGEIGRSAALVDFYQKATDGTVPLGSLDIFDKPGHVGAHLSVTVPLDRTGSGFGEWIPKQPSARVTMTSLQGAKLAEQVILPGETMQLPGNLGLRLVDVGWYARLGIVDDWTPSLIYISLTLAMLGLTLTLVMRQQIVLAAVVDGPDGKALALDVRLWRNAPTNRAEIESALTDALLGNQEGNAS